MLNNSNELNQTSSEPTGDLSKLSGPGRAFTHPRDISENLISASGELLLHGSERSGVWLRGSPLLDAHEAVRSNIKVFLSDWKQWRPEETLDRMDSPSIRLCTWGIRLYLSSSFFRVSRDSRMRRL